MGAVQRRVAIIIRARRDRRRENAPVFVAEGPVVSGRGVVLALRLSTWWT